MQALKQKSCAMRERFTKNVRGNVGVLFALSLLPVAGAVGAAVDYSRAQNLRTKLQSQLDAAAIAGIQADDPVAAAHAAFQGVEGGDMREITFNLEPDNALHGLAAFSIPTTLASVFGYKSIDLHVETEAVLTATAEKACIILLDPSKWGTYVLNGQGSLVGPECAMHVHSGHRSALIFNTNNGSFNLSRACVRGDYIVNGTPAIVAPIERDCDVLNDPFSGQLPVPEQRPCDHNNRVVHNGTGTVTLQPGVYCGGLTINGRWNINFAPGFYEIRNETFVINGNNSVAQGRDVSFYFADPDSSLLFNGTTEVELTAPRQGQYEGILFFEPPGLSQSFFSDLILNGTGGFKLEGMVYLPTRRAVFNANSRASVDSDRITMVLNDFVMNGSGTWRISPSDNAPDAVVNNAVALRR